MGSHRRNVGRTPAVTLSVIVVLAVLVLKKSWEGSKDVGMSRGG